MIAWSSCSAPGNGTRRVPNRVDPAAQPVREQRAKTPEQSVSSRRAPDFATREPFLPAPW